MKTTYFTLVLFIMLSGNSYGGCEKPFGEYSPKNGTTVLRINDDQTVKISRELNGKLVTVYSGKFTDFDEMKGTIYLNHANPIDVAPDNNEQSHICLHVAEDCSLIKAGVCIRSLELFGGKPPKLGSNLFFRKND